DGFPVPKARVTFFVMGGGGSLLDPVTGDVGAAQLTVLSDARGEAQVKLVLGQRTDLVPRYQRFEGDEFSTQVGMNLVTARPRAGARRPWPIPSPPSAPPTTSPTARTATPRSRSSARAARSAWATCTSWVPCGSA